MSQYNNDDESNDNGTGKEFHKHFWKYAIGGLIIIITGMVVYKILGVLVNNPLTRAIDKVFGAAGLVVGDFTEGCCTQEDCSTSTEQNTCLAKCGCGWSDAHTDTDPTQKPVPAACGSKTNIPVGEGGPMSIQCPLFIFLLIGALVWIVFRGISIFRANPNPDGEHAAATEGLKYSEYIRQPISEGKIEYNKKLKDMPDDLKGNSQAERYLAERCMQISNNRAINKSFAENSPDWNRARDNARTAYQELIDKVSDDGLDPNDRDSLDKIAESDGNADPFSGGE